MKVLTYSRHFHTFKEITHALILLNLIIYVNLYWVKCWVQEPKLTQV